MRDNDPVIGQIVLDHSDLSLDRALEALLRPVVADGQRGCIHVGSGSLAYETASQDSANQARGGAVLYNAVRTDILPSRRAAIRYRVVERQSSASSAVAQSSCGRFVT